jgi:flagellar basal body rod protein FlgC
MKNLIEKFKKQPQLIFVAVLAALLVIRILIFLSESSFTGDERAKPTIITLKPKLTMESPEYTNVNNLLPPEKAETLGESKYGELVQVDVFDPNEVQSALENRPAADAAVTEGYVKLAKDDLDGAMRDAEDSLRQVANNRGALALQREIAGKFVAVGRASLESEPKDLDAARENAEKALAIVPEFDKALELKKAIEDASKPAGGRSLMGSGSSLATGNVRSGADDETTPSATREP